MNIVAIICLVVGIGLIITSVILFFKLDVRDAFRFINHKRKGVSVASVVKSSKPRKQRKSGFAKSSGHIKDYNRQGRADSGSVNEYSRSTQFGIEDSGTDVVGFDSVETQSSSEFATEVLRDESEQPTGILQEVSEQPTGILVEDSEQPTGILVEDSEQPTGILVDNSEQLTGVLTEDSEHPTGILTEGSELPTGILAQGSDMPTGVLQEDTDANKDDVKEPEFYFEIIQNDIVIHTNEEIK